MKKLLPICILISSFLSNYSVAQRVKPQQDDNTFILKTANVDFEATTSYGGRITSLKIDGNELLYLVRDNNNDWWGSILWPSPQSVSWPPSTALDGLPYHGGIQGDSVNIVSDVDGDFNLHLKFRKSFYADLADTSITLIYYMINTGTTARSFSPWEVTRVPAAGMAFFPYGTGSITGSLASYIQKINGIAWFEYQGNEPAQQKYFSDGSEGWSAFLNPDNVLFIKKYKDGSKPAPNENEIEFYYSGSGGYFELENQGEYTSIPAGDSIKCMEKWYVRNLPASISGAKGSGALVNYVRNIVKGPMVGVHTLAKNNVKVFLGSNNTLRINGLPAKAYLSITDLTGNIVLQRDIVPGDNAISLNYPNGLYLYQIKTSDKSYTGKIILKK